MTIPADVVALLRCPKTKQTVSLGEAGLVVKVNACISAGRLLDQKGGTVVDRVDALLVCDDGVLAYCVRDEIAEMTIDAGVRLDQIARSDSQIR